MPWLNLSPKDLAYSPEAYQLGLQYYQQVKYREIFSDIQAMIAYFKTLPDVKADASGCIGFCYLYLVRAIRE